jgi:hypothetical protein
MATERHKLLNTVKNMKFYLTPVTEWFKGFRELREGPENDPQSGQLSAS